MRSPFGLSLNRWQIWLLYAAVHSLAVAAGIAMMVRIPSAAALWPPVGTFVAALLIYPRSWRSLISIALVTECAVTLALTPNVTPMTSLAIASLDVGQGALAAWLFRVFVGERPTLTRVRPVVMMTLCFAAATFIGSLLGAYVIAVHPFTRMYWMNQQTWWLGGYLGTMVFVPLIVSWARFGFRPFGDPPPKAVVLTVTQFAALVGVLAYVFSRDGFDARSVLDSPALVYPALLWIALDGGPRRLMMGLLLTVVISTVCTLNGIGPFHSLPGSDFTPTLILQGFLALALIPVVVVHAVTYERRDAMAQIRASDERYRAFVAHSSEAIFRVELSRPMPVSLRASERRAWIARHTYLAETNVAFRAASPALEHPGPRVSATPPWLQAGLDALADIEVSGERLRDFECAVPGIDGVDRTLLVSLTPVVNRGLLRRVWGAARDVSHMRSAQRELERQELELRALATELTLTEERTRRRIAADLHDGIAQSLVGMQMHVTALRRAARSQTENDDVAGLELALGDAISQIRALMTELLPPGLYDQGIVAGLRWLADRFGERERVRVTFEDDGLAKPLDEPVTVLLFQTARQLLQNVARHARASEVHLALSAEGDRVTLQVEDTGVGFDTSQLTFLPSRRGGFGLFSIRERIKMIGGTLAIASAPERGTRIRVTTPMRLEAGPFDEALRARGAL